MINNPVLLALTTIVLWSFGSYLSRLISIKSQFVLLCLSFAFTVVTLFIFSLVEYKNEFRKNIRQTTFFDLLFGLAGYFVYSIGLIQSYRAFNSASETTILNYTWPIFTVIFTETLFRGVLTRPRLYRVLEHLGIGLGFLSVVILATRGNLVALEVSSIFGIAWGLVAGISYGLFSAYSGTVPKQRQTAFLLSASLISFVFMLILSIREISLVATFSLEDYLAVAALGCLLDGIGYITWTSANRLAREKNIRISSIAALIFALPLLSLTIITLLLKETRLFQPYYLASLFLIVLSGILCQKTEEISGFLLRFKIIKKG